MRVSLATAIKRKLLVEICRSVDGLTDIDGYILDASKRWILVSDLDNLRPDGYYLFRRETVRSFSHTKYHKFRDRMIKREGLRPAALQAPDIELSDISNILAWAQQKRRFLILLNETNRTWHRLHCVIHDQNGKSVILRAFDGAGCWEKDSHTWPLARITCVRFGSHYLNLFERYAQKDCMK